MVNTYNSILWFLAYEINSKKGYHSGQYHLGTINIQVSHTNLTLSFIKYIHSQQDDYYANLNIFKEYVCNTFDSQHVDFIFMFVICNSRDNNNVKLNYNNLVEFYS